MGCDVGSTNTEKTNYNNQRTHPGASAAFFQRGATNSAVSEFNQKYLHLPKCLLSMNNDIIVYN